ncbi:MAG: hypothetical protein AABZ45_01425 [Pseudomonadota bacterium]
MATITVRKVDDDLYSRLGNRAAQNSRSLEAEVRAILAASIPTTAEIAHELADFHGRMRKKHGLLPDSTPLIRQMRDEE